MTKISSKYNRKIGIMFLLFYLAFLSIGIIHYHFYDLIPKNSFNKEEENNAISDLYFNFFSYCGLHQFSQTISDFHYSSSNIIKSPSLLESNLFRIRVNNFSREEYSQISARASPKVS